MKDNNKAKLLTVGIAVVLILIVCGISVIIYALNKRNSQDTNTMLQEDIMEYAAILPFFSALLQNPVSRLPLP